MAANSPHKLIRNLRNILDVGKSQKDYNSEVHQTLRTILSDLKQYNLPDFESEEVKNELCLIEPKDFPVEFGRVLGFILIDLSSLKDSIHPYVFVSIIAGANAFELGLFDISLDFYSIANAVYEKSHAYNKCWRVTVGIKNNLGCVQSMLGEKPSEIELQILVKFEKRENKTRLYCIVENNLARAYFKHEGNIPRDIIPSYENVLQKISMWSKSKGKHRFANPDDLKITKSRKEDCARDHKRPSRESEDCPRDEGCRALAIACSSRDQWSKSNDVKTFSVPNNENPNLPLRMLVILRNYADYRDQIDTYYDWKDFCDIDLEAFDEIQSCADLIKVARCSIVVLHVNHGDIKRAGEMNQRLLMDCPSSLESPSGLIVSKEIALAKIALGNRMVGKSLFDDTIRVSNHLFGVDHPITLDLSKTRHNLFSNTLTDSPSSVVAVNDLWKYQLPIVVKMFTDCDQDLKLKPDASVWRMLNKRILVGMDCLSRDAKESEGYHGRLPMSPEHPLTLSLTTCLYMVSELYYMYIDQEIPALILICVRNLKEFLVKVVMMSLVGTNVSCLNAIQLSPSYGLHAIAGLCFLLESALATNALALVSVCETLLEVLSCIYDCKEDDTKDPKLEFYKDFNGQISFYLNYREATVSSGLARLCTIVTGGRRDSSQFTGVNEKEQPLFKTTALQNGDTSLDERPGCVNIVVAQRSSSLLDIDELRKLSKKTLDNIFFQKNALIECTPSWSDPTSRPDLELLKTLPAELEGAAKFYAYEFQKNLKFSAETEPAVLVALLHHHFTFQVPAEEINKASAGKMKFFFRRHGLLTLVWEDVKLRLNLKTLCPSPFEVDAMPTDVIEICDDVIQRCSNTFEVRPLLDTPWHRVEDNDTGFFNKESEERSQTLLEENFKLRSGNAYLKKMLHDLMKSRQEQQENVSSLEISIKRRQSVDRGWPFDEHDGPSHDATVGGDADLSLCSHDYEQTTSLSLEYGVNDPKSGKTHEDDNNHLLELGEAEFRRETAVRNLKRSITVQQDVINYKKKNTSLKTFSKPGTRSGPIGNIDSACNYTSYVNSSRHYLKADNNLDINRPSSDERDFDPDAGQSSVQKATNFDISGNSSPMQMCYQEAQECAIWKKFDSSDVVERSEVLELSIDDEKLDFPDATRLNDSDTSLESFKSANDGFFDECDAAPDSINIGHRSNIPIIDTQGLVGEENDKETSRANSILNEELIPKDEIISEDTMDEKELFLPPTEDGKTSTFLQNDQHAGKSERDLIFEDSRKDRNPLLWVSDNKKSIDQYCLQNASLKAPNSTNDKDPPSLTTPEMCRETAGTRCENIEQSKESCNQLPSRLLRNVERVVADGPSTTSASPLKGAKDISKFASHSDLPSFDGMKDWSQQAQSRTNETKELRGRNVNEAKDISGHLFTQGKEFIEASFQSKPTNQDHYVYLSPSINEGDEALKKFWLLPLEQESDGKYRQQDRHFEKTSKPNKYEENLELFGRLPEQQSLFDSQAQQRNELFVSPRPHSQNASGSTRDCRLKEYFNMSLDSSSCITHDEASEARAFGISKSFLAKHSTLPHHRAPVYPPYMSMPVLGDNSRHTIFSTLQISDNFLHEDNETGLQSLAVFNSDNKDECENKSSLHVAKDIRIKEDEMRTAINLATTLQSCEMYEEALLNGKKCLEIAKELTNVDMEMRAMKNIAMTYQELGKYDDAVLLYRQCEYLSKEVGDKLMEAHVSMNLSLVYLAKNELNEAFELAEKSFRLSKESGDERMEMNAAKNIGSIYQALNNNQDAIIHYRICMEISCEVSDKEMEMQVSRELALLCEENKQIDEAIACNKRSLNISKELYDKEMELSIVTTLASLYQDMGQYNDAIAYKQRCFQIATYLGDKQLQLRIAEDLAKAYASLKEFENATFYQQIILEITMDLGDRQMEMRIIREIAILYQVMGKVEDAIVSNKRCLEICVELDKEMAMNVHSDLTVIFKQRHMFSDAIVHSKQCLDIAEELGEKKMVMTTAVELGELYEMSNQFNAAIDLYKRSLEIAIEISEKGIEMQAVRGLATSYQASENLNEAITFLERSLAIAQEIGDTGQEMQLNNELAEAYKAMGKCELCIVFYEKALIISRRINDQESEIQTSRNIASIHKTLNEPDNAVAHLKRSVEISKEIGNKEIEMQTSQEIGALYKIMSQYEDTIAYYKRSLLLAKQLENQRSEMLIYMELALSHKGLSDYPGAIECAKCCLHIARHLCDKNIEMKACLLLVGLYEAMGKFDEVFLYGRSCVEIAQESCDKQAEFIACLVIGQAYQKIAEMKALPQPTWKQAIKEIDKIFAVIQTSIILPSPSCLSGCFEDEGCSHTSKQSHGNLMASATNCRRSDKVVINEEPKNPLCVPQGVIEIVLNADIPMTLSEVYQSLLKREAPILEDETRLNSLHQAAKDIWNSVNTVVIENVSSSSRQEDPAANNLNTENGMDGAVNAGSNQDLSVKGTGIPIVAAVTVPSTEQRGQTVGDQNACEDEDLETCQMNGGSTQSLHQTRGKYSCTDGTPVTGRAGKTPVEDYSETCGSVVGEFINMGDIPTDDEIQTTDTSDTESWWQRKAIVISCSNEPTEDNIAPSENRNHNTSRLPTCHIVTPNSAVHQSTERDSCSPSEGNNPCHEEVQQLTTTSNIESCSNEGTENNVAVSEGRNQCNSNLPTCQVVTSDTSINDPEEDSEMRSLEETVSRVRDSLNGFRSLSLYEIDHRIRESLRRERELGRQRQLSEIEQLLVRRKERALQSNNPFPLPASLPVQISDDGAASCAHFKRGCDTYFPCCKKFYRCHRCHNQSKDCEVTNSKAADATKLRCRTCNTVQDITRDRSHCIHCKRKLSEYFCGICKHYTANDKKPYHCEPCGICRINKDNSFHCDVCNVCLNKRLKGKHKCRANSGHDECCICLEDAFSGCQVLPCSHKVHRECAVAMIKNGVRTCPICRAPIYE